MGDIGLLWNERKCVVVDVKRGSLQELAPGLKIGEQQLIESLTEDSQYKFLGVLESIKQEDSLVLESTARVYLQRLSFIWSSPLSDRTLIRWWRPTSSHCLYAFTLCGRRYGLSQSCRDWTESQGRSWWRTVGNTHWELAK